MKGVKYLFVLLVFVFSCGGVIKGLRTSSTTSVSRAPYYVGKVRTIKTRVGYFPVVFDKRLEEGFFEEARRRALLPILDEMNAYLDRLNVAKKLPMVDLPVRDEPDIYVGNEAASGSPATNPNVDGNSRPDMIIYRYNPSQKWKEELLRIAEQNDVDYALFITLGISEYFVRQKNLLGSKELELGTGYKLPIKWLTDLNTPVEVLHVSGALLDKNGKILRAGAEGIVAKQTGFLWSLFDVKEMLTPEDIRKLLHDERRKDLPDKPLTWQVSLQNLVAQLLGRTDLIVE